MSFFRPYGIVAFFENESCVCFCVLIALLLFSKERHLFIFSSPSIFWFLFRRANGVMFYCPYLIVFAFFFSRNVKKFLSRRFLKGILVTKYFYSPPHLCKQQSLSIVSTVFVPSMYEVIQWPGEAGIGIAPPQKNRGCLKSPIGYWRYKGGGGLVVVSGGGDGARG